MTDLEGSLYLGVQNCGCLEKSLDYNLKVRKDLLCVRLCAGVGWDGAEVGDGIIRTRVPLLPNNL